jgi:hypothetical protein
MKIPNRLKILGREYEVECFDFDSKVQCNNLNGSSYDNRQKIQIDNTSHHEKQEATLLHETLHILSYNLNLSLDEDAVCRLEVGLYQVLKDNKLLKDD